MRLIQPLKFRTLKTGCFKMPRLQTPHLQTGVFQTGIRVASGHNVPHFKGLINAKVELEAQGRDSTFTICHPLLKKAILEFRLKKGNRSNIFLPECK